MGCQCQKQDKEKYRFYNFPFYIDPNEYARIKKKIISHLMSYPQVVSVYTFGRSKDKVNTPGISDIDFVFVVDESKENIPIACDVLYREDPLIKYVRGGGIGYPVTRDYLSQIKEKFQITTYDFFYEAGERILISDGSQKSSEEKEMRAMSSTFEMLFYITKELCLYKTRGIVNVRGLIKWLTAIMHHVAFSREFCYEDKRWDKFIGAVASLRKDWFNTPEELQKEKLLKLLDEGIVIIRQVIDYLADFMREKGFQPASDKEGYAACIEIKGKTVLLFSDCQWRKKKIPLVSVPNPRWQKILASIAPNVVEGSQWKILVLPAILSRFFEIHAQFPGALASSIKKGFLSPMITEKDVNRIAYYNQFQKQASFYNSYWEFLIRNKYQMGYNSLTLLFYHPPYLAPRMFSFKRLLRRSLEPGNLKRALRQIEHFAL